MRHLPQGVRAVLLLLLVLRIQIVSSDKAEDHALDHVRRAVDAPSARLLNWSRHTRPCGQRDCDERTCNWRGVACSKGRVVGINVTGVVAPGQVSGQLAKELSLLSALRYIVIADQNISGSLPAFLSKLPDLSILDFHNDSLSGTLPASWSSLPVTMLDLSQNPLVHGSVPATWVTMPSLTHLNLAGTGVCGSWVDLHRQWPDASITHDMVMKTCDGASSASSADPGRGQDQLQIDRKAKYTVLLVMYIVAGVFIVLCVVFLVGHTCLSFGRRMRVRQQRDGGGLPATTVPASAPAASCPAPPPGPPPIIIIMPGGRQMAVGYPVAGAGLKKSIELTPAASPAATGGQRSSPSAPAGEQQHGSSAAAACEQSGPSTPASSHLDGAGTAASSQQSGASAPGAPSAAAG